jgi:hypothetical protein
MRRLIEAVTEPGDMIVNPCARSFAAMHVAGIFSELT